MSDIEFLIVTLGFFSFGYVFARIIDIVREMSERQREAEQRRQAFIEARRPRFHPSELMTIQERAELDDLRDYIRSKDA